MGGANPKGESGQAAFPARGIRGLKKPGQLRSVKITKRATGARINIRKGGAGNNPLSHLTSFSFGRPERGKRIGQALRPKDSKGLGKKGGQQ